MPLDFDKTFRQWPKQLRDRFMLATTYRQVFNTPQGRIVLADLLKVCGAGQDLHVPGDTHETARLLGMHRIALRICAMLNLDEQQASRLASASETAQVETEETAQ